MEDFLKYLLAVLIVLLLRSIYRGRSRGVPRDILADCGRITTHWTKDILFHMDFSIASRTNLKLAQRCHEHKGHTFLVDSIFGSPVVETIAPENLRTMYTQGKDFGIEPHRLPGMEHFCGQGFLTVDGQIWSQSRKMMKPTFARANISDFRFLRRETDTFISTIRDDVSIDIQPLLFVMFFKLSMHFLFGQYCSAASSVAPCTDEQFVDAFQASIFGTSLRILLGPLRDIVRFTKARRLAHDYIDSHVKQALKEASLSTSQNNVSGGTTQRSMSQILASQTSNISYIRSQILQGVLASQETTAVLVSNTLFLLARHNKYWKQLRHVVLERGESLFTLDNLNNLELLQNILKESLRLYPIFPLMFRTALQDTTLPTGGGPYQNKPIYIRKGTKVQASFYALHRDPRVFSPHFSASDVEEFIPERWDKIHPQQWEYAPFGGGQRACMGKEKTLAEASFVICKLAGTFEVLEARDERPWKGRQTLSAKNIHGCKIALRR